MATQQRSRSRRPSSSRSRGPRHVEAVLDPTWQSPYAPAVGERELHHDAFRRVAVTRELHHGVLWGALAVVSLAGVALTPWFVLFSVVIAIVGVWRVRAAISGFQHRASTLGADLVASFSAGGTSRERQRLLTVVDRLTATFGVDAVSALIIDDPGYNAALVPTGSGYSFVVTSAVMRDFELIELEGVVAHCLARDRLGILLRQSAAALSAASPEKRRSIAGVGLTYRADEVAAAAIRYPLGLAGALRRCARQVVAPTSYFASPPYDRWRYVWFDVWSDRAESDLSDLDDVELRALALEEW